MWSSNLYLRKVFAHVEELFFSKVILNSEIQTISAVPASDQRCSTVVDDSRYGHQIMDQRYQETFLKINK